jgi:hypothetical protein
MRYFTVEEANAFIPALQVVFGRIEKLRLEVVRLVEELEQMGDQPNLSSGVVPDDLAEPIKLRRRKVLAALAEIRQLVAELESHGLVVKKLDGLVEFRSRRGQRPVFLCWRRGETHVDHWHELWAESEGQRQPIDDKLSKQQYLN